MKRIAILGIVLFFFSTLQVHAFEITSDPQYVVMNFSTITNLNWAAPEAVWQTTIKPQVLSQLDDLERALPRGTPMRQLAWSTLMEYMNTPLDTPSATSPYAVKMRRILEISDERNLPVFIPLNGFQWLDQLPELYNWWDPDGTHTDQSFFARQSNPVDFKQRFIAAFDPNNRFNVEWQGWNTPMKLNVRNWGGGGFRLAPPPALTDQHRTRFSYRSIQKARLEVILNQITPYLQKWQIEGRSHLFAGLSIGTEVSLNASITPQDEFIPYGYRSIQDTLCPENEPTCGNQIPFTAKQMSDARIQSVNTYFVDLARFIQTFGIPKQRIYTHVWSESLPGDKRYENYTLAAFTPYSRGGMSFYGFATNPLSHPDWNSSLLMHGKPAWGAVEYSAGTSQKSWDDGLAHTFNNGNIPAKIEVTYNWDGHKDTGAINALRIFLSSSPIGDNHCAIPEIIPDIQNGTINPAALAWHFLATPSGTVTTTLYIFKGAKISTQSQSLPKASLASLLPGVYSWYVEAHSCDGYIQTGEPRTIVVLSPRNESTTPNWVTWILTTFPFSMLLKYL